MQRQATEPGPDGDLQTLQVLPTRIGVDQQHLHGDRRPGQLLLELRPRRGPIHTPQSVHLIESQLTLDRSGPPQLLQLWVKAQVVRSHVRKLPGPCGTNRIETESGARFVHFVEARQSRIFVEGQLQVDLPVGPLAFGIVGVGDGEESAERNLPFQDQQPH